MNATLPIDGKFPLMELPYPLQGLEPAISATTLQFHHGKHLATYIANLNKMLPGSGLEGESLETVVARAQGALLNNAGQVLNHNLYFTQFTPGGRALGDGPLAQAINRRFGSLEDFQREFAAAGASLFGSGWVWLSADQNGELVITQEANAGNPVRQALCPLLTMDVWEHAYYLDYQNRRPDHLAALWQILDWQAIAARYPQR